MSKHLAINQYNINDDNLDIKIKATDNIFFGLDKSFDFSKYTHITHLTFGYYFNQQIDNDKLPPNITHLTFGWHFNQPIDNLPQSITYLSFGFNFNQPVNKLPLNITHLFFGEYFDHPVDNLPQSITHLTFGDCFNQNIDNLPQNITHLTLGHNFNKTIDNLPNTLIEINFKTSKYYENYNINMLHDNIQIIKCKSYSANLKEKILLSRHADKLKTG